MREVATPYWQFRLRIFVFKEPSEPIILIFSFAIQPIELLLLPAIFWTWEA